MRLAAGASGAHGLATGRRVDYRAGVSDAPPPSAGAGAPEAQPSSRLGLAGAIGLLLLGATWAWWAWQDGAYFAVVLLPGTVLLCAGAALLIGFAPLRIDLRLSKPVIVALVALVALAAWAALSALWSPAPDTAVGDGQRIAVYALAFGLGVVVCNLLGPRMKLSLLPLAFAGAFAGVATIIALHGADRALDVLETDGTLDFPLGYRNANAAFFAVAMFPALGLAADRDYDWRLRALSLGTATLCIDLLLLSQSRASIPAMAIALVVYTLASPYRVCALCWLLLATLPALGVLPALTDLYHAAGDAGDRLLGLTDEMQHAAAMTALTSIVAIAVGAVAAFFERRLPGVGRNPARGNRAVLIGLAGLALAGLVGFVVAVGNPATWVSDRAHEFRYSGTPDLSGESSRFGLNLGSNRYDAWRVALLEVEDAPLNGGGGGAYQYAYLQRRDTPTQNLRDAHSVEMELLSELGIVGLVLFVVTLGAATIGVLRARKLGPAASGIGAIALASATYWLIHTSVDWFWPYPAVTAPVLGLLGCACAPAVRAQVRSRARSPFRIGVIVAVVLLAMSAVPPFLSQRYVDDAYDEWRTDLPRAYDDLDRARSLNRLSDLPLLAEGSIAQASGDQDRALSAFREAEAKRPEEWATHYLLAELQLRSDRAAARDQIRQALSLNPLDPQIRALARKLDVPVEPSA